MRRRSEAKSKPQREENVPQREFTIDVPNDPVNEQVVLAAMMVDTETCDRLLPLFPADAFYANEHRAVREALAEMRRRKLTFDPATVARLAPDVDIRILEQLPQARPDVPDNIDFHVDTLLWDARRAQATRGPISSLLDAIQDPKESPERVRAIARQVGQAFDGNYGRARYLRDPKEIVRLAVAALSRRAAGEAYYPYGIHGLDYYEDGTRRIRPGAAPGKMTLVTALSGSGKSTLMCLLALQLARQRRRILFGAWEEDAPTTIESLTVMALEWSRSRILDGKSNTMRTEGDDDWGPLTHDDLVLFEETAHKISSWVTFFDNPFQLQRSRLARNVTNDDHLDIIQDHLAESGADVFFADLLHRCLVDDSPSAEKLALYRMLAITQEQKVHTIAAHQQRAKDIETRDNKRPTREGIIGSGAWLDVFWTVLAPHLPAKWKDVPDNSLELFILKQRNGPWPIGIEFGWDPDTGQITGGKHFDVKNAVETSEAFGARSEKSEKQGKKHFRGRR